MSGSGSTAVNRASEPAPGGSTARLLLAVLLGVLLLATGIVGAGAALLYGPGQIRVVLDGKGSSRESFHIRIPAGLVLPLARLVPAHHLVQVSDEARHLLPAIAGACRELERMPDAVLVSVESPEERVIIAKRAKELVILADTEEDKVSVAVPLKTLSGLVDLLEKRSR
jgi:hypothetical protein